MVAPPLQLLSPISPVIPQSSLLQVGLIYTNIIEHPITPLCDHPFQCEKDSGRNGSIVKARTSEQNPVNTHLEMPCAEATF